MYWSQWPVSDSLRRMASLIIAYGIRFPERTLLDTPPGRTDPCQGRPGYRVLDVRGRPLPLRLPRRTRKVDYDPAPSSAAKPSSGHVGRAREAPKPYARHPQTGCGAERMCGDVT